MRSNRPTRGIITGILTMGDFFFGRTSEESVPIGSSCECCGTTKELTRDHKIPKCRGGTNAKTNIGTLCTWCNQLKGSKKWSYDRLREFRANLIKGVVKAEWPYQKSFLRHHFGKE